VLRSEVEVAVLRDRLVGLVDLAADAHRLLGLDVPEAGVLEEVPAERVARVERRLVAGRDPGAALDEVVLLVEGRRAEVVVERMHVEAGEAEDRGLRPLPDVPDQVVERADPMSRHRRRRGVVLEVDVAGAWSQSGWSAPPACSGGGPTPPPWGGGSGARFGRRASCRTPGPRGGSPPRASPRACRRPAPSCGSASLRRHGSRREGARASDTPPRTSPRPSSAPSRRTRRPRRTRGTPGSWSGSARRRRARCAPRAARTRCPSRRGGDPATCRGSRRPRARRPSRSRGARRGRGRPATLRAPGPPRWAAGG
jgi:hypothetical protein